MTGTPKSEDGETTIRIPVDLDERIRSRITGTDFDSVEEYVRFVLEEVVADSETRPADSENTGHEAKIADRLEDLGYR